MLRFFDFHRIILNECGEISSIFKLFFKKYYFFQNYIYFNNNTIYYERYY